MQAGKGAFVGLGFIIFAIAILVGGYAIIWPGEYFWHNPPFESPSAFQDAATLFKAYVQEKATIDKQHAEALRRNAQDTRKAKESKDREELFKIWAGRSMFLAHEPGADKRPLEDLRQAALTVLEVELWHNLPRENKTANQELVEKYQETFSKRANEERTAQLLQQIGRAHV